MADKDVLVSVVNNKAVADPATLNMGTKKNQKIAWSLDDAAITAGWRFASNGVVITNAGTEFEDGGFDDTERKKFKWKDKNDNTTLYQYTINLVNGNTTIDSDPAIQNGADSGGF